MIASFLLIVVALVILAVVVKVGLWILKHVFGLAFDGIFYVIALLVLLAIIFA